MRVSTTPVPAPPADHEGWHFHASRGANGIPEDQVVTVIGARYNAAGEAGSLYHFEPAIAQAHRGVEILVETGGPKDPVQVLADVEARLDAMPAAVTDHVHQVVVYRGQDVAYDTKYERDYRIPGFHATAFGGGGLVAFFGGYPYTSGTFYHELGHNLPVGPAGFAKWFAAQRDDDVALGARLATGQRLAPVEFEPIPDPVRRARWVPRLVPGGVTPYGDGRPGEDLAESMKLLLSEQQFHHAFATTTSPAGAITPLRFADAYPNRTAFLERAAKLDLDGDGKIGTVDPKV